MTNVASYDAPRREAVALLGALAAFLAANVLHNRFGVDFAVLPAGLLGAFYWLRPRRGLLRATALLVVVPSLSFLDVGVLRAPADGLTLANHVALLAAGLLGVACLALSLLPRAVATPAEQ